MESKFVENVIKKLKDYYTEVLDLFTLMLRTGQ